MYDFHKVKQDKHSITFRNELFTRSGPKELKNIKRKAPRNPRPVPGDSSVQQRATPSSKNSHQPTSKQSAQHAKRTLEQEALNSCWHFEKSLKQLQKIVLTNEALQLEFSSVKRLADPKQLDGLNDDNTLACSTEPALTAAILDAIYGLKKKCWTAFGECEELLLASDKSYQIKLATITAEIKHLADASQELEMKREKSACSLQRSQPTSSCPQQQQQEPSFRAPTGFKPFSSQNLNRMLCTEETKIASTPLINTQDP